MDNLIDLDKDYGYKYTAINDKVSHDADKEVNYWKAWQKRDPGDVDVRNISDGKTYENEYKRYKNAKVDSFKRIEKMIGRNLTDEEMIKIYDLLDVGHQYDMDQYTSFSDEDDTYDGSYNASTIKTGKESIDFLKIIAKSIDEDIFSEFYDNLMEDIDIESVNGSDTFLKKYKIQKKANEAYGKALFDKYGSPDEKEGDKKDSDESVDENDIDDILDFEKIYKSSELA